MKSVLPDWTVSQSSGPGVIAVILLLSVVPIVPVIAADGGTINSWFGDNADGWTIEGDATSPEYMKTGGNPGGHVCADDNVAGNAWYFAAPEKFLGDRSGAYGRTLQFDMKQSSTRRQFSNHDVILGNGSSTLVYDFGNASQHPQTDWTHYSVPLEATAEGWTLESGASVSATTFETVLRTLTELRIRGEFKSGSDRGCLDNVQLPSGISEDEDEPPRVSIVSPLRNGEVVVENSDQTIAGSTNLPDGTQLNMTVQSEVGSDVAIFRLVEIVVTNNTFAADFDFRSVPVGTQFTVQVREGPTIRATRDGRIIERPASVQVMRQEVRSRNPVLEVASADLPVGGYIAIHEEASLQDDNSAPSVLGSSSYLSSGEYSNILVRLNGTMSIDKIDVVAVLHRDDNGNNIFEFASSGGQVDKPYFHDGSRVNDSASISVISSPTLTATRTPVPSPTPAVTVTLASPVGPDTAQPTARTDTTETTGSEGPGFGIFAGLLALSLSVIKLLSPR